MPIVIFLYCLFGKGLIFDGRAGLFYALQRSIAEAVLSLLVLEKSLRARVELETSGGLTSIIEDRHGRVTTSRVFCPVWSPLLVGPKPRTQTVLNPDAR